MQKYFIRHRLSVRDTTFLSDSDSELAISRRLLKLEDLVEIETLEKIFLGQVVDILPSSIEIEILKEIEDRKPEHKPSITLIQSLSNDTKFNYFVEKSVEIGIEKIIPVESQYSLKKAKEAMKDIQYWEKIIKDATEQSRNSSPTLIYEPVVLKNLDIDEFSNCEKICLATESIETSSLEDFLKNTNIKKPFVIAIGPEKGWSSSDLAFFRNMGFEFISLKGNILRTETTGLVIASIIKYLKGEI